MRSPLLFGVVCAVMILAGIALATVSSPVGSVVALIGVIGFGALLMYAGIRAFFTSPGMYYAPGKARREWKAEQEAARRAEQRWAGREE